MPQDRPSLALPPEMAQQIAMQQKVERAGRQLLESLACAIYTNLAAHAIRHQRDDVNHIAQLEALAAKSIEAAIPMAAQLGWHFQQRPDAPGP